MPDLSRHLTKAYTTCRSQENTTRPNGSPPTSLFTKADRFVLFWLQHLGWLSYSAQRLSRGQQIQPLRCSEFVQFANFWWSHVTVSSISHIRVHAFPIPPPPLLSIWNWTVKYFSFPEPILGMRLIRVECTEQGNAPCVSLVISFLLALVQYAHVYPI